MLKLHTLLCAGLLVLGLASSAAAQQTAPEIPAAASGWQQLSSHEEVRSFYFELAARSEAAHIRRIGHSRQQRPIYLVTLSRTGVTDPAEAHASGKPIVFVGAQIHGDEPAGKEGLMRFARELVFGELSDLLDEAIFLLVPQMNPDGGEAGAWGTRANAAGYNLNRDFPRLVNPEAQAVAYEVIIPWRPHVVVDAHELVGPPRIYDFYTWHPNNPNAPYALYNYADEHLLPEVERALNDSGYTHIIYHTPGGLIDRPEEGISVPVYGRTLNDYAEAQGSISVLFESLREDDARVDVEDRANRHFIAMRALALHVAENSDQVIRTVERARNRLIEQGRALATDDSIAVTTEPVASREIAYRVAEMAGEEGESPWEWEPTGETLELVVPLIDSARVTSARRRPAGYLIEPHRAELAADLARQGVQVQRLAEPSELQVESYRVDSLTLADRQYEGYVPRTVHARLEEQTIEFPEGTFFVPAAQRAAALVFKLFEPEDENSYATTGAIGSETRPGRYLPLHRLPEVLKVRTEAFVFER